MHEWMLKKKSYGTPKRLKRLCFFFTSCDWFFTNILLPCLSLFQRGFFPQCEPTSCIRTGVGIFIIPICTTCLCYSIYWPLWLWNPWINIGWNVAYSVSPNPSGENVLHRRRRCWRRRLFHRWYLSCGFFLCTGFSYPL